MTGIDKAVQAAGSKSALAALLGISQQAVSKMQRRGFCPIKRAEQIAAAFPIPVDELLNPEMVRLMRGE